MRRASLLVRRARMAIAVLALLLASTATRAQAQAPSPTPVAPGNGGVTFGSLRVLAGNNIVRNAGFENQPPVWMTIDAKGASAVVTVGNATRVPLDFNHTVVIELAPGVEASQVLVTVGSAVIQGSQVVWTGFSLASGQIQPAVISLASNGAQAQPAAGAPAISKVDIEARDTQSGAAVTETAAGGGPAVTALPAATPAVRTGTSGAAAATSGSAAPLSGSAARTFGTWALALLAIILALLLLTAGLVLRTGRRVESRLSAGGPSLASEATSSDRLGFGLGAAHRAEKQPDAVLEAQDGAEPGRRWVLNGQQISVGRNPLSDIALPDPRVSDRHARLTRQPGGSYQLVDDGSTNGTRVNGDLLSAPAVLRDGDVIRFGNTTVVFRAATAPQS